MSVRRDTPHHVMVMQVGRITGAGVVAAERCKLCQMCCMVVLCKSIQQLSFNVSTSVNVVLVVDPGSTG